MANQPGANPSNGEGETVEQKLAAAEAKAKAAEAEALKAKDIAANQRVRAEKAETTLKGLSKAISDEQSGSETISESTLEAVAAEYKLEPDFVAKFAKALAASSRKEVEKEFLPKLEALEKEARTDKFEKAFSDAYSKAINGNPDYEKVANPDVIKSLVLLPANKEKTVEQLLQEAYGKVVPQKQTPEVSQPGSSNDDDAPFDLSKMRDREYYAKVKANPKLWKQYSEALIKNGAIL